MFGYVRPQKEELKVKEFELYRAVYCGLCKTMGKRYAHSFRVTLSYDFVFLALLQLYLTGESVSFEKKRCFAHPTKKRVMMKSNSAMERATDVAAILLCHSVNDKIADGRKLKRAASRFASLFAKRYRKKAIKKYGMGETDSFVKDKLDILSKLEKDNCDSLDRPASNSGEILSLISSYGLKDEKQKRIAEEIGYNIGRVIYILDAADDVDDDLKNGCYNPLLAVYGTPEKAKEKREALETTVRLALKAASDALALADEGDPGVFAILDNAFRLGILKTAEDIFKERKYHD